MRDARKKSLYFPEEMVRQIEVQAERLDRSASWLLQLAWKIAHEKIAAFPSHEAPRE